MSWDCDVLPGSKLPQIKSKYFCQTQNADRTPRGKYQVNFLRHNKPQKVLARKVAIYFHPGHLLSDTEEEFIRMRARK